MGNNLKKQLKNRNFKLTGQRETILNLLTKNSDKHLSADEIYNMLRDDNEKVGVATVYRTLSLLEKLELVSRIILDDGRIRYQFVGPQENLEHHHLICERCGKIIDIQDDLMGSLHKQIKSIYGFNVTNYRVKLYGICSECLNKSV